MLADLHIHTTFSDGIYTPEQIIDMSEQVGIKAIAITDHDNTNGHLATQNYLAKTGSKIKFIPGVEIDTFYGSRDYNVHVLGYYINDDDALLQEKLAWTGKGRVIRINNIISKLQALGFKITQEEVKIEAKGSASLGRPHIARVLIKKGYFTSVKEVFDALIGEGKPAYCKQEKLTPKQAVEVIHHSGGIASFAHPSEVGRPTSSY
jgi:predicted metal-dependent phosphoesterase TrpH